MSAGQVQQFFLAWASHSEVPIPSALLPGRRLHSLSLPALFCGFAYRARLQTMDNLLPDRPALLFNFMLPSGSEHFLLDFWITDSHLIHLPSHRQKRSQYYSLNEAGPQRARHMGFSRMKTASKILTSRCRPHKGEKQRSRTLTCYVEGKDSGTTDSRRDTRMR